MARGCDSVRAGQRRFWLATYVVTQASRSDGLEHAASNSEFELDEVVHPNEQIGASERVARHARADCAPRQWGYLQLEFYEASDFDGLAIDSDNGWAGVMQDGVQRSELGETRVTWPPVSMIALISAEWIVPASEAVAVVVGRISGGGVLAGVPLLTAAGRD